MQVSFWTYALNWRINSKFFSLEFWTKYLRQTLCEIVHYGKFFIFHFSAFSCQSWPLGYDSIKFWDLPDLILSFKSFGNSWDNSHTPCLLQITTLRFTCGEKRRKVSKSIKILYPQMSEKFSFAFYVFIESSNC